MFLGKVLHEYVSNFKVALGFGLLLVFFAAFSFLPNAYVGSGTIFLEYGVGNFLLLVGQMLIVLLYLVFYSLFISVVILAVRRDLSKIRLQYYISEMIKKFTVKIFTFYALLFLFLFVATIALMRFENGLLYANMLSLAVALATLFVPQAIVVDECSLKESLRNNQEFISKNFRQFFAVLVVGAILLALALLIEFALDSFYLIGRFVSLFLVLVFVLPFVEVMKTYLYMHKFDLIRSSEKEVRVRKKVVEPASLKEVKRR